MQAGDQGGSLPAREPRAVVEGDQVGEDDLVVVLEVIPGDVEEVARLVLVGLPGDPGHRDQPYRVPDLLCRYPEVFRDRTDADPLAVDEKGRLFEIHVDARSGEVKRTKEK